MEAKQALDGQNQGSFIKTTNVEAKTTRNKIPIRTNTRELVMRAKAAGVTGWVRREYAMT